MPDNCAVLSQKNIKYFSSLYGFLMEKQLSTKLIIDILWLIIFF